MSELFVIDRVKAKYREVSAEQFDECRILVRKCFTEDEWDIYIKEVDLWMEIIDEKRGGDDIDGTLRREIVERGIENPNGD